MFDTDLDPQLKAQAWVQFAAAALIGASQPGQGGSPEFVAKAASERADALMKQFASRFERVKVTPEHVTVFTTSNT